MVPYHGVYTRTMSRANKNMGPFYLIIEAFTISPNVEASKTTVIILWCMVYVPFFGTTSGIHVFALNLMTYMMNYKLQDLRGSSGSPIGDS